MGHTVTVLVGWAVETEAVVHPGSEETEKGIEGINTRTMTGHNDV